MTTTEFYRKHTKAAVNKCIHYTNHVIFKKILTTFLNDYRYQCTVKPVIFVCLLFCKFCEFGNFAKIMGHKYPNSEISRYFSVLISPESVKKTPKLRASKLFNSCQNLQLRKLQVLQYVTPVAHFNDHKAKLSKVYSKAIKACLPCIVEEF